MASDSRTLHIHGWRPPEAPIPRITLKAAPAIRNVYSCRFPTAALPPEFSKRRPVIVVSWKNSLQGPILIVPLTTQPQTANHWAVKLASNPSVGEDCDVWAVCNHLYTVSCIRLTATHGTVPRLSVEAFQPIQDLVMAWIPGRRTP